MDSQTPRAKPEVRWLTMLAGGYLLLLFIAFGTAVFLFKPFKNITSTVPTPTVVSTPHILVHPPANKNIVLYEDFSSNKNEWGLYHPFGKLEVINGKLILQSNIERSFVIGKSSIFDLSEETYYVQADFITDIEEAFSYGLIFGIGDSLENYYMFEITPGPEFFRLHKYNTGKWDELVPYTHSRLKPYPQVNTLSVYFDAGNIELYINGEIVSSFLDENAFRSTGAGVFVTSNGYRLIVDDFFAYTEQ